MKTDKWLKSKIKSNSHLGNGVCVCCVHTAHAVPLVSCSCHVQHINKRPGTDIWDLAKLELQLRTHRQQVCSKEKSQAAEQCRAASPGSSSQILRNKGSGASGGRGQQLGLLNVAEAGAELTHHVFWGHSQDTTSPPGKKSRFTAPLGDRAAREWRLWPPAKVNPMTSWGLIRAISAARLTAGSKLTLRKFCSRTGFISLWRCVSTTQPAVLARGKMEAAQGSLGAVVLRRARAAPWHRGKRRRDPLKRIACLDPSCAARWEHRGLGRPGQRGARGPLTICSVRSLHCTGACNLNFTPLSAVAGFWQTQRSQQPKDTPS